jgi:hypothetical protein
MRDDPMSAPTSRLKVPWRLQTGKHPFRVESGPPPVQRAANAPAPADDGDDSGETLLPDDAFDPEAADTEG